MRNLAIMTFEITAAPHIPTTRTGGEFIFLSKLLANKYNN